MALILFRNLVFVTRHACRMRSAWTQHQRTPGRSSLQAESVAGRDDSPILLLA